jgi:hypothetical protein
VLPFLKLKDRSVAGGILTKTRTPDEKPSEESNDIDSIEVCAKDLIRAVHGQDAKGAAEAIRSAFQILDSEPHEEGPHVEPHSYAAQNQLASKSKE